MSDLLGKVSAYIQNLPTGASVNLRDRAGETAVLLAATNGNSDIIKELANHKADVNMTTTNGRVPLIGEYENMYQKYKYVKCKNKENELIETIKIITLKSTLV